MVLEEAGDGRRFFVGVWSQLGFARLAKSVLGSSVVDMGVVGVTEGDW
jgi:hypothetical protein